MDFIINALEVSDFVATLFRAVWGALFMPTTLYCYLPQYIDSRKIIDTFVKKGAELDVSHVTYDNNKSKLFCVFLACNNKYCNLVLGLESLNRWKNWNILDYNLTLAKSLKSVCLLQFSVAKLFMLLVSPYFLIKNMFPIMWNWHC